MASMTLMASAIAWYGFVKVGNSVTHIVTESLPAVTWSLKLSEKTKEVFAVAPALVASTTQRERGYAQATLEARTKEIDLLIKRLEATTADRKRIEALKRIQQELTSNLAVLNQAVQKNLLLKKARETVVAELAEARASFMRTLKPLIGQSAMDIIASGRPVATEGKRSSAEPITDVVRRMQRLLMIRAESTLAAGLITEAAGVLKKAVLVQVQKRFTQTAKLIRESIRKVPTTRDRTALSEDATWLLDAGDGVENVFELRLSELKQLEIARAALNGHRSFQARIEAEVSALIAVAEASSKSAADDSAAITNNAKIQLVIITGLAVFGATATFLFFVLPRVVHPIVSITGAMSGLAKGDVTIDIPARERADEIGRMAQSLKVFRDTAIEVQESNLRELQETRRRLSDAIESIPQGFALYDPNDRLVMCNSTYSRILYQDTEDIVTPGTKFETVIRNAVERGLIAEAEGRVEEWVEERLARRRNPGEAHLQRRSDGRWILISERSTEDGGTVAVYENVTELKEREIELAEKSNALEQLSNQLAKYLSPQLYDSIFSGKQDVRIMSSRKKLTVFFSDIEGFTETADKLESEELTQLLNHYLTEMSRIALQHGGTIDKYIGDAILIFFGDPETNGAKEDALACVRMAIAMRKRLRDLEDDWRKSGIEKPLRCRMGIHTGFCTVGNFGSEDRMDYTIIGGAVNTASRLEAIAMPGEILISYETFAHVRDKILCEEYGETEVKGIAYPVTAYQVVDSYRTLGKGQNHFREKHSNVEVDLNLDAMTSEDRNRAEKVLRRALHLLKRDENFD